MTETGERQKKKRLTHIIWLALIQYLTLVSGPAMVRDGWGHGCKVLLHTVAFLLSSMGYLSSELHQVLFATESGLSKTPDMCEILH